MKNLKIKSTQICVSQWEFNMQKMCDIKVRFKTPKVHEQIVLSPDSLKISKLRFSADYSIHREI